MALERDRILKRPATYFDFLFLSLGKVPL